MRNAKHKQLAESYGTDSKRIANNFGENKDRYTEGKHYFKLEGNALRTFNGNLENFEVAQNVNKLYLWTEKGAWLHAKSLNTDNQLEENLLSDGCRDALVTWDGIILDGHNRYEICNRHDMPYKIEPIDLPDRDAAVVWIIRNQFGRRNLPIYVRGKLALKLEDVIKERAKANKSLGGGDKKSDMQISAEPINPITTRKEIAKIAGVSHDTIDKIKVIEREATPEQKEALKNGTRKVNQVYREIRPQTSYGFQRLL